jgi:hypothetical protein
MSTRRSRADGEGDVPPPSQTPPRDRNPFGAQSDAMRNPLTHLRGLWSEHTAERLRAVGVLVLLLGIAGACVRYWIDVRSADPAMDELSAPGYLRARQREAKDMMGPVGVILLDWQDTLAQPWMRALLVLAAAAIITLFCFRAAAASDDTRPGG